MYAPWDCDKEMDRSANKMKTSRASLRMIPEEVAEAVLVAVAMAGGETSEIWLRLLDPDTEEQRLPALIFEEVATRFALH